MATIYTAEIQAYDPGTSGVITYRVATHGFVDAGTIYEPRIEKLPTFSRSIRTSLVGGTSTELSFGELRLLNGDGGLNAMRDDYFDGRKITIKKGDSAAAYGTFTTVMIARIAGLSFEPGYVSVRIRDRLPELNNVYSDKVYGGTNSLPNGVDGRPDDIKGQYRPAVWGIVSNMQPVLVNTSKLIYEVCCEGAEHVRNVFGGGAYLEKGSAYSTESDMYSNQPAPGTFRLYQSGSACYFRLGSTPYGKVTCSVFKHIANSNFVAAAGMLELILLQRSFVSGTDYNASDFTTLKQKSNGPLGIVVQPGETIASLIDRICGTVGAWWGFDLTDQFRVKLFDFGSSVAALTAVQLRDIEGQASDEEIPWRITIPGDWNYATQAKSELAGIAQENTSRVGWLTNETRDQTSENTTIKTQRLTAREQRHDGYFTAISQAQAEATRRLGLFGTRRDVVTAKLMDYASYAGAIDLGVTVTVQHSEIGYTSPRTMIVTGIDIDLDANTADLTLWG
jgi:hypothetical protein